MRKICGTLILLALAAPARADLAITGPDKVPAYKIVKLTATGADPAAGLLWRYDKAKLDGGGGGSTKWLVGPPGVYVVEVTSIVLGKDGRTTVEQADFTFEIAAPGPGPTPPTPPTPPAPTTLQASLQAAYNLEVDPNKVLYLRNLTAAYTGAGADVAAATTMPDLFSRLSARVHDAASGIPSGALPRVGLAVGDYLNATLGNPSTAALDKPKAAAAFAAVADALRGVK